LFPLEVWVDSEREKSWFEPLTLDAVYLHAMVFTSQSYFSLVSGRDTAVISGHSQHLTKALRFLRERLLLGDEKATLSDATIMVVVTLAIHTYMTGDHQSAGFHFNGLQRLVRLRGGITSFRDNSKLLV
jgi:hypothetical protein